VADPVPPQFLATAIEAVLHAGDVQMAHLGRDIRIDKKSAIDLVTEIDIEIERQFRAMIAERFPDHTVLGEEFGTGSGPAEGESSPATRLRQGYGGPPELQAKAEAGHYTWVFDPIDGTTNYAHGLPIFCSSLALEIDGEAVVGAIYDPNRRELFTAERGQGAWMNGAPLRVSRTGALIDSLLVTGFHYDIHKNRADLMELFSAMLGRARAVRRLGSAAIDLCYVAAGRFDGFWEKQLHAWDVAAGALIVAEAGGVVTTMDGSTHQSRKGSVLATNGLIHQEMLDKIREVSNPS
jgi:myo-inositol-1(or 4)-monophosphatase